MCTNKELGEKFEILNKRVNTLQKDSKRREETLNIIAERTNWENGGFEALWKGIITQLFLKNKRRTILISTALIALVNLGEIHALVTFMLKLF